MPLVLSIYGAQLQTNSLRLRVAQIVRPYHQGDTVSFLFDVFLIALILTSVFAVVMSTVESFANRYQQSLWLFEIFTITVFTVEYLVRVWSCVEDDSSNQSHWRKRWNYVRSPMAIIDLIAIVPFYLGFFIELDLRSVRVVRLLRIGKLGRYSRAMEMLLQVLRMEFKILLSVVALLLVLMLIASTGIYLIESKVQPDVFGSIPQAMWWAMATLTTVGYGDVTPITPLGKFFAGSITILSMGMVALPAGILASSFSEQLRVRRELYAAKLLESLQDGVIDDRESAELERLRERINLSEEDARHMLQALRHSHKHPSARHCPHCGKDLQ